MNSNHFVQKNCASSKRGSVPAGSFSFSHLFSNFHEAIVLVGKDQLIVYTNKKAELFLGSQPLTGGPIKAFFPKTQQDQLAKSIAKGFAGESTVSEHAAGTDPVFDFCEVRCTPLQNDDGTIDFVYLSLKEIGKEKETAHQQMLLEKCPHLFEVFMENSPLVAWITDAAGIMQYMNPTYKTAYNFNDADRGRSIFELFPKEVAQDFFENNHRTLAERKAVVTIEKAPNPDGSESVLKIYKFPIKLNGELMVGGWAIDVTDQIKIQEQLSLNIERYHYVNKATSDAIYDWNIKTMAIYRGQGFLNLFGFANLNGSIRFSFTHIHPNDVDRVKAEVFSTLRNEHKDRWELEYRFKDAKGNYRTVFDKAFIIRESGKALRVIGAMQDISRQKKLQEKIVQQEKLNRRNVVRSIIETQEKERRQLSVELHDNVNQILSSCKLMLEVARTNPDLNASFTEKAYVNLQTVISEIRKISHELNPAALQDIGLVEAINQMIGDLNASGRLNIVFTHEGCQEKKALDEADRIAVFRIVQEKLTNILKHSEAKNAFIRLNLKNKFLSLQIGDDGIGFDPTKVKNGIGLKNIQNRVEYYQGSLVFDAVPGKGTDMKIQMYMKQKQALPLMDNVQ